MTIMAISAAPQGSAVRGCPFCSWGASAASRIFACGMLIKDTRPEQSPRSFSCSTRFIGYIAHRAMSDVPSEAFTLAALAIFPLVVATGLVRPAGTRPQWCSPASRDICAGLSLLSKFSGFSGS